MMINHELIKKTSHQGIICPPCNLINKLINYTSSVLVFLLLEQQQKRILLSKLHQYMLKFFREAFGCCLEPQEDGENSQAEISGIGFAREDLFGTFPKDLDVVPYKKTIAEIRSLLLGMLPYVPTFFNNPTATTHNCEQLAAALDVLVKERMPHLSSSQRPAVILGCLPALDTREATEFVSEVQRLLAEVVRAREIDRTGQGITIFVSQLFASDDAEPLPSTNVKMRNDGYTLLFQMKTWMAADTDRSGAISTGQMSKLFHYLNAGFSKLGRQRTMRIFDDSGNGALEWVEFHELYQMVTTLLPLRDVFLSLLGNDEDDLEFSRTISMLQRQKSERSGGTGSSTMSMKRGNNSANATSMMRRRTQNNNNNNNSNNNNNAFNKNNILTSSNPSFGSQPSFNKYSKLGATSFSFGNSFAESTRDNLLTPPTPPPEQQEQHQEQQQQNSNKITDIDQPQFALMSSSRFRHRSALQTAISGTGFGRNRSGRTLNNKRGNNNNNDGFSNILDQGDTSNLDGNNNNNNNPNDDLMHEIDNEVNMNEPTMEMLLSSATGTESKIVQRHREQALVSRESLIKFLREKQDETSELAIKNLFDLIGPPHPPPSNLGANTNALDRIARNEGYTFFQVQHYLTSHVCNSWRDPIDTTFHHPMNHPLCHYYINSSHNTYLDGKQFLDTASLEMYDLCLREGCRCVEIDCWNGRDGEPIVTHGHAGIVNPLTFRQVIEVVNRSAFLSSPYPVILSLEVHTDDAQQTKMAHIMEEIFGDRLVRAATADRITSINDPQFTPEALKHKILAKNKYRAPPKTSTGNNNNNSSGVYSRNNQSSHHHHQSGINDRLGGILQNNAAAAAAASSSDIGDQNPSYTNKMFQSTAHYDYDYEDYSYDDNENNNEEDDWLRGFDHDYSSNAGNSSSNNNTTGGSTKRKRGKSMLTSEKKKTTTTFDLDDDEKNKDKEVVEKKNNLLPENENNNNSNNEKEADDDEEIYDEFDEEEEEEEDVDESDPNAFLRPAGGLDSLDEKQKAILEKQQLARQNRRRNRRNNSNSNTKKNKNKNTDDGADDDEEMKYLDPASLRAKGAANSGSSDFSSSNNYNNSKNNNNSNKLVKSSSTTSGGKNAAAAGGGGGHAHRVAVALAAVTFIRATVFKIEMLAGNATKSFPPFGVTSKSEEVPAKWITKDADILSRLRELSSRFHYRIYPAFFRTDSSNYDPMPGWLLGGQMVALNFQTNDWPVRLNRERFRTNGNCGYVLKPSILRGGLDALRKSREVSDFYGKTSFTIKVICGLLLPRPPSLPDKTAMSPVVVVILHGTHEEVQAPHNNTNTSANRVTTVYNNDGTTSIVNQQEVSSSFQNDDHNGTAIINNNGDPNNNININNSNAKTFKRRVSPTELWQWTEASDNGLVPEWNAELKFVSTSPQVAMVSVYVYHSAVFSDYNFAGGGSCPLLSMRKGIRAVPIVPARTMSDPIGRFEPLPPPTCVLVDIDLTHEPLKLGRGVISVDDSDLK